MGIVGSKEFLIPKPSSSRFNFTLMTGQFYPNHFFIPVNSRKFCFSENIDAK